MRALVPVRQQRGDDTGSLGRLKASSAASNFRPCQRVPPRLVVSYANALSDWGVSAAEDTVSLLVTELVSNGVRHAHTALALLISFDGVSLRISVADADPRPPVVRPRQERTMGGWGLALIDSLSADWGTHSDATGKTVWFEIDTSKLKVSGKV